MKYKITNNVAEISLNGLVSNHASLSVEFISQLSLEPAAFQFFASWLQDTFDIRASLLHRMMFPA